MWNSNFGWDNLLIGHSALGWVHKERVVLNFLGFFLKIVTFLAKLKSKENKRKIQNILAKSYGHRMTKNKKKRILPFFSQSAEKAKEPIKLRFDQKFMRLKSKRLHSSKGLFLLSHFGQFLHFFCSIYSTIFICKFTPVMSRPHQIFFCFLCGGQNANECRG